MSEKMKGMNNYSTFLTFSALEEYIYGIFYVTKTDDEDRRNNLLSYWGSQIFCIIQHLIHLIQIISLLSLYHPSCDTTSGCLISAIPQPIVTFFHSGESIKNLSIIIFSLTILALGSVLYISINSRKRSMDIPVISSLLNLCMTIFIQLLHSSFFLLAMTLSLCSSYPSLAPEICSPSQDRYTALALLWIFFALSLPILVLHSLLHNKMAIDSSHPSVLAHGRLELPFYILKLVFSLQYVLTLIDHGFSTILSIISCIACLLLFGCHILQSPFLNPLENRFRAGTLLAAFTASIHLALHSRDPENYPFNQLYYLLILGSFSLGWVLSPLRAQALYKHTQRIINDCSTSLDPQYLFALQEMFNEEIFDDKQLFQPSVSKKNINKDSQQEGKIRERFDTFLRSSVFRDLRESLIFNTDAELLVREIGKQWDSYSPNQKMFTKTALYEIFLGLARENDSSSFSLFLISQFNRVYFEDITAAASILKTAFDKGNALDVRFGCYCSQKSIDILRTHNAIGRKSGKNHLADLALFRKTTQNARLHHERALKLLSRTFKQLVNDDRQMERNSEKIHHSKKEKKEGGQEYTDEEESTSTLRNGKEEEDVEEDDDSDKEKKKKTSSNSSPSDASAAMGITTLHLPKEVLKERVTQLQLAVDSINHASTNYDVLQNRFPNNPDAIKRCRIFRQHFVRDEVNQNSNGSSRSESSDASSQSSASITGEKDSIKKQKTQAAITAMNSSFSLVRIGAFISLFIVACMMSATTVVIIQQLDFVSDRIKNLSYVENMYVLWPKACNAFNQMSVIVRELNTNGDRINHETLPISVDSSTQDIPPLADIETYCQDLLNFFSTDSAVDQVVGCMYSDTQANGFHIRRRDYHAPIANDFITLDLNEFGNVTTSTRPENKWYSEMVTKYAQKEISVGLSWISSPETVHDIERICYSVPLVHYVTGKLRGVFSVEVIGVGLQRRFSNILDQLNDIDRALQMSVAEILKQATKDGNTRINDIFMSSNFDIRIYSADGTYTSDRIGLQRALSLFSTHLGLIADQGDNQDDDSYFAHPSYNTVSDICMGDAVESILSVVDTSISFVSDFINQSYTNVALVVSGAMICLVFAVMMSIVIVRKNLSSFDCNDGIPLAVRMMLLLDVDAKKAMLKKFRQLKLPKRDDEQLEFMESEKEKEETPIFALTEMEKAGEGSVEAKIEAKKEEHRGDKHHDVVLLRDDDEEVGSVGGDITYKEGDKKAGNALQNSDEEAVLDERIPKKGSDAGTASPRATGEVKELQRSSSSKESDKEKKKKKKRSSHEEGRETPRKSERKSKKKKHRRSSLSDLELGTSPTARQTTSSRHTKSRKSKKSSVALLPSLKALPLEGLSDAESPASSSSGTVPKQRALGKVKDCLLSSVTGAISRWFLIIGVSIGTFLLTTSIIVLSRMDKFTTFQTNINDIARAQVNLSAVYLRSFDLVVDEFSKIANTPTSVLRNDFLNYLNRGNAGIEELMMKVEDGESVIRRTEERSNFVFSNVCIDPEEGCTGQYPNQEYLNQGLYRALLLWVRSASEMHKTYVNTSYTIDSVSIVNSAPADLWWLDLSFPQICNGLSYLRGTFVEESDYYRDMYRDQQFIFYGCSLFLILLMWSLIEYVLRKELKKLRDVHLIMKILPWDIIVEQKIFVKYFKSKGELDEFEEDEDVTEENTLAVPDRGMMGNGESVNGFEKVDGAMSPGNTNITGDVNLLNALNGFDLDKQLALMLKNHLGDNKKTKNTKKK